MPAFKNENWITHPYNEILDEITITDADGEYVASVDCGDAYETDQLKIDAVAQAIAAVPDMINVLQKLDYWFDADPDVLAKMDPVSRVDHERQHAMIKDALEKVGLPTEIELELEDDEAEIFTLI